MLTILHYTLNELKTLFQKSWEWRIGYVLIGCFIIARWLGLFSSLELIALDFFLSHRVSESSDEHISILLIDKAEFQRQGVRADGYLANLVDRIFEFEPAVVGLNIFFREPSGETTKSSRLVNLFETHDNLVGVQKGLPPKEILPLPGVSNQVSDDQFGINDLPIDRDGQIRRVYVGTYLPDETPENSTDNPFKFSFAFKIAQKYLEGQGYSLENLPGDPKTPSFKAPDTERYVAIPRLKPTSGGYIRDPDIADIQTLLNFRAGTNALQIIQPDEIATQAFSSEVLKDKIVIVGAIDTLSPNFLPVSASSNLIDESNQSRGILFRLGIVGSELEAHSVSQIINAVLHDRPLIKTLHPLFGDILIILAGVAGILIGNTFGTTLHNAILLVTTNSLLMGGSYVLLSQLGIWVPALPASSLLAIAGVTYIAFYQSERLSLMEARNLEEERRKAIEKTFNAIHAGPLQTLASLLRNVRDGRTDQDYLLDDLESLNREIRGIGERLRQEAIEDVYFVDMRRDIKLDLTHPMHEVLYEVYSICVQKDLPGFADIKVRSVAFEPFSCEPSSLEIRRKLCWFLQESLENVGKHAMGTTRLLVSGKGFEEFYTLRIEDNGPGVIFSHVGEGTKFFYRLETLLRGKFSRISKPSGGTICELTWPLSSKKDTS